ALRRLSVEPTAGSMGFYARIILVLVVLAIGGGLAFLLTWDIPPPTGPIEKVVPDARFEK
ncbi:MAG: hypothetical protein QF767_04870, partial [Alphaproteobacteria bacterium]|nr:hypothetical protein [Alphaproteobacteria bacterium]